MAHIVNVDKQTEDERLEKAFMDGYEFAKTSGLLEQIKGLWDEFEKKLADQAKLAGHDEAAEDAFVDGAANAVGDLVDEEITLVDDEDEGEGDE